MIPYIIEIGPVKIPSYGFMLMVAFMVDYYLLTKELKRLGKDPEMAGDAVFWAAIGGIVGSSAVNLHSTVGAEFSCFFRRSLGNDLQRIWPCIFWRTCRGDAGGDSLYKEKE